MSQPAPKSPTNGSSSANAPQRIHASGEMAERIRSFPWHETVLGPIADWPDALVWSINLMLESRFPTSILWGTELLQLYNDAYLPLTAEKHPSLLGQPCAEQWPEAWHIIGPQFDSVYERGETIFQKNVNVPVRRQGIVKDVYWTYSYSPIRDLDGAISGILIVCHDVTGELLATRERDAIAADRQAVLSSITDGMLVLDKEWRYTYFNEQGARMIGIPVDELVGHCVWDLFPYAQGTKFYECYHQAVDTGQPTHFEEFYPEPLNKWLECHCYPSESGLTVYFRDISERKRADQTVAENEARLNAFVDTIPALAWMADGSGYIFWYNRRWYEYTGATADQMKGWGWQAVHDPSVLPSVMERWTASIASGEPFDMVFPLRGADGVFRSFLTRIVPVKDLTGKIIRWFGTNMEIDEMQRTREELAASQQRIRIALQSVPLILYTADRDLRYTWMHRAHDKFDLKDILGRTDDEINPSEASLELMAFKRSVIETGKADRREFTLTIQGVQEIYDISAEPLRNDAGSIIGVTVAALDITRQKLSEEALRKSEKLAVAGRLAATISHEINNPLEAVTNLLYLLRTSVVTDQSRAYVHSAEAELARVSQIVTQSLRFHRQSTAPTEEKLSGILESATAIYNGRIVAEGIHVKRDYRDHGTVCCYASELRQVFGNLIGNAFDAVRQSGTILLRTRDSRDALTGEPGIRVTVADSGHGMDAQTLNRITEPFFTTKGVNGTGLGLWISRDILQKHHATMHVRSSQREGICGTVFSIFVPSNAIRS